ncbi:MAG: diaminopropionate ammonia-lyase, partial [Chthoniobacterales bacterium]
GYLSRPAGTERPLLRAVANADELIQRLVPLRPLTLLTAADGNHGRAVAYVAALFGLDAKIYVPAGTAQARIDGIASEGAQVEIVHGTYDDAVARAAQDANERCLVISDTSWPGYEKIPRWVAAGYSTIFAEIDDELARRGEKAPDLVAIQFGVGALAAALVRHAWRGARPRILGVEPLRAACGLESMRQDEIITVPGPHDSIMAGLNCGRPSLVAWPIVARGIDAFIAVSDNRACEAMRSLQKVGVVAGETGAAGLAGLLALLHGPKDHRTALGIGRESRALLLITEGATDPDSYQRIVGHRPRERTASRPAAR